MEQICKNLDFCAGNLTDDSEDFYYDTRFQTFEEAYEWAVEHHCTHVYDAILNKFIRIGDVEELDDMQKAEEINDMMYACNIGEWEE